MANNFSLNPAQIKGLSGLFFNLATGLILGGVGFTIVGPLTAKLFIATLTFILAIALILFALEFLKEVDE